MGLSPHEIEALRQDTLAMRKMITEVMGANAEARAQVAKAGKRAAETIAESKRVLARADEQPKRAARGMGGSRRAAAARYARRIPRR